MYLCAQTKIPSDNHWTIGSHDFKSCEFDPIFWTKLPRTTYEATIEATKRIGIQSLSHLLNFKRIAIFLAESSKSFIEDHILGLQAKEQDFPKQYPTTSPSDS